MTDKSMRISGRDYASEESKAINVDSLGNVGTQHKEISLIEDRDYFGDETIEYQLGRPTYSKLKLFISTSANRKLKVEVLFRKGFNSNYPDTYYFERTYEREDSERVEYELENGSMVTESYVFRPIIVDVPPCENVVVRITNLEEGSGSYIMVSASSILSGDGSNSNGGDMNHAKIDGISYPVRYELDDDGNAVLATVKVDGLGFDQQEDSYKVIDKSYDDESQSLKVNHKNREIIQLLGSGTIGETITENYNIVLEPPDWANGASLYININEVELNEGASIDHIRLMMFDNGIINVGSNIGAKLEKAVTKNYSSQLTIYPGASFQDTDFDYQDGLVSGMPIVGDLRIRLIFYGSINVTAAIVWVR